MNGKIGVLFPDSTDEAAENNVSFLGHSGYVKDLHLGSLRLEKTSHIFDTKYVDPLSVKLVHEI